MMNARQALISLCAAVAAAAVLPGIAHADTKDVVLDRVNVAASGIRPAALVGDAMVVSVLVESPDGTLAPRAVNGSFRTGERFRVKLLPSRDGMVSFYNTNPAGKTTPTPLWRRKVTAGLEVVSPRLRLDGTRGTDKLHIVLERPDDANVFTWLGGWISGARKDIRLDEQNTPVETYLLGSPTGGLVTTLSITHR